MSGLTVLFVVLAVVLTVPVYAFAVRRLLGLRLSPLRAWIGGLIALACASPIITAIGSSIAKHNGSWSLLPAVWFVILGVAIALLIGMLVLVIFEALVPSGWRLPGARSTRHQRPPAGRRGRAALRNRARTRVHLHIPGRHPRRDGRADARSQRRPDRNPPSHAIRVHRLLPPRVRRDSCAPRTVTCVPPRRRLTQRSDPADVHHPGLRARPTTAPPEHR